MFRFAIMGAGGIARHFCGAVRLIDDCIVCAVASKSRERAERFAAEQGVAAYYDDYERMLVEQRPDCAYIATTVDAHFALSMLCLKHSTPVLCEKAMFMNGSDASACLREAARRRTFVMEATWSRFLPAINCAREWVGQGRIGRPVCAEMSLGFAAPKDAANRYFNPALGGGAAYDLSIYGHELLTWVLDREAETVGAEVSFGPTGVDTTEIILLRLGGQLPAMITASVETAVDERMTVYGTEGKLVIPRAHMAKEAFLYSPDGGLTAHYEDRSTAHGFTYEIEEAMRAIRAGKLQSDTVPHRATLMCAGMFDVILHESV